MTATVYDVLDELRASATSEADKGRKLELLIQAFLRTDPVYADQFSDVWLWREWPGREGKPDTGIDLVAADRLTGGRSGGRRGVGRHEDTRRHAHVRGTSARTVSQT